jgi:peptide/nickel transport system permease protein
MTEGLVPEPLPAGAALAVPVGAAPVSRRFRGGPGLSMVLPGAPQLLAGRMGVGGAALFLWLASLTVFVFRWERVRQAPGGALDARVALATLALGLIAAWIWSLRDIRKGPGMRYIGVSQWTLAGRAFSRNRLAVLGALAILVLYWVALVTPLVAPFEPAIQGNLLTERLIAPGREHLLGTDHFARDVLSRVMYGARVSLSIGFIAVGISVTIGTLLGAISGYFGRWVDMVIMRLVDMMISFPQLVLLITIVAVFQRPSIFLIVAVLGLTQWPNTTRIVRGEVLSLREREFIQAARALGFSNARIILFHLIPNVLAPVIVAATLGIGNTIIVEAGLSFLGLGVQPPTPSWGTMVSDGRNYMLEGWWLSAFSGLAIVVTVLCFNLVGDGLRDALDPRLRR